MSNPYAPPKAALSDAPATPKTSVWFWLSLLFATASSLVLGLIGVFVVPEFAKVFDSFGADLPAQTLLLLQARHALWLPTLLSLALWGYSIWQILSNQTKRLRQAPTYLLIALNCLLGATTLWALYSPIFTLGQVQ